MKTPTQTKTRTTKTRRVQRLKHPARKTPIKKMPSMTMKLMNKTVKRIGAKSISTISTVRTGYCETRSSKLVRKISDNNNSLTF